MESELRRLLRQIDEEYNAAYSGMNAFSMEQLDMPSLMPGW